MGLFLSLDKGQNLMSSGAFLTYRIGGWRYACSSHSRFPFQGAKPEISHRNLVSLSAAAGSRAPTRVSSNAMPKQKPRG